ncbi:MAG: aminotransferase class V-fold PLP-dependent enzyme [Xanthobacteraceae bacterium]|nr:aminotransferase class V-fold PLP-dependent enzyme [Xanthobacteraceae bacterium]
MSPVLVGAGQEGGRRPGTENVAAIAALGEACRLAGLRLEAEGKRLAALSEELFERLAREVPGLQLVGDGTERLPSTVNVLFPGVSGRRLLEACPRVQASTGSACHADLETPSAILGAIGIPDKPALGAVRLSLGRTTTLEDVVEAAPSLAAAWHLSARRAARALTA